VVFSSPNGPTKDLLLPVAGIAFETGKDISGTNKPLILPPWFFQALVQEEASNLNLEVKMKISGFANIYADMGHPFEFSIFLYPLKLAAKQAPQCDDKSICVARAMPIQFEIPDQEGGQP